MVKRKTIKLLKDYLNLLRGEGINVYKAYMFGSHVTGLSHVDSDIDLMIVSEDRVEQDDKLMGKIWSLTSKISTRIEPFIVGQRRFSENNDSPLIEEVKKSGIEIKV